MFTHAQQKPPLKRTTGAQVVSDRALKVDQYLNLPHGTTPSFPNFVADSNKLGTIYLKTTDTSLYIYDGSAWVKYKGSGGGSSYINGYGLNLTGTTFKVDTTDIATKYYATHTNGNFWNTLPYGVVIGVDSLFAFENTANSSGFKFESRRLRDLSGTAYALITDIQSGLGTVTSITPGNGFIDHTPITATGIMDIDSAVFASKYYAEHSFSFASGSGLTNDGSNNISIGGPLTFNSNTTLSGSVLYEINGSYLPGGGAEQFTSQFIFGSAQAGLRVHSTFLGDSYLQVDAGTFQLMTVDTSAHGKSVGIGVQQRNTGQLSIMTIYDDAWHKGFVNNGYYEAQFTDLSLTTKHYVDSVAMGGGGGGISLTDLSATAPVSYNNATGVFSMHVADVSHDGYLDQTDWATFNAKLGTSDTTNLVHKVTVINAAASTVNRAWLLQNTTSNTNAMSPSIDFRSYNASSTAKGIRLHNTATASYSIFDVQATDNGTSWSNMLDISSHGLATFYNSSAHAAIFDYTGNTTDRTYTMPDKDGTFAMLSDITGGGSGTVNSITPGIGFVSHTPITVSGTMDIDTTKIATRGYVDGKIATIAPVYFNPDDFGGNGRALDSSYYLIKDTTVTSGSHYAVTSDAVYKAILAAGGGGITALTGEVTASGTGSVAATINKTITPHWTGLHVFGMSTTPTGLDATNKIAILDDSGGGFAEMEMGSTATSGYAGSGVSYGYIDGSNVFNVLYGIGAETFNIADPSQRDFFFYDQTSGKYKIALNSTGIAFGDITTAATPTDATLQIYGSDLFFPKLTSNTSLALDGSNKVISVATNGTGNDVRTDSPILTGTPSAPTPGSNINTTQIPTTAWMHTYYAPLISPSFTTPNVNVATATTVNKVTITAPATGSTLTIINGKTFTANNSIAISGTDGTVVTFPAASTNVVGNPNAALNILASTQTTLVAGTKALSVTGVTTTSHAYVGYVVKGGTVSTTVKFAAVCTSGTVTITALTSADATDTTDTSTVNVFVTN